MGISKASFGAEKMKNQLEDTRYAGLLRKCIDFLVASLLIMLGSLVYGACIYSHKRSTKGALKLLQSVQLLPRRQSKTL